MLSIKAKIGKKTRITISFCTALSIPSMISLFLKNLRNNRVKKKFEEIIANNSMYEKKIGIAINHNLINCTHCTDDELLKKIKDSLLNPTSNIPDYLNILRVIEVIDEKSILNVVIPNDILDKIDQITLYIMEFKERKRVEQISCFIRLVDTLNLKKKAPNNRHIQSISLNFHKNQFKIEPSRDNKFYLNYKMLNIATIEENKITIDNLALKDKFTINDTNIYKIIKNIKNILSYIVKDRGTNSYSINTLDMFFEILNDLEDVNFLSSFIKLFLNFEKENLNSLMKGLYSLITSLFQNIDINILKPQILKNTITPKIILNRNNPVDLTYSNVKSIINQAFDKNIITNFTITEYINSIKMAESIIMSISTQIEKNSNFLPDNIPLINFFLEKNFIIQYFERMDSQEKESIKEVLNDSINKLGNIESIKNSMLSIFFDVLDFSCKSNIYYIFKKDNRFNSIQNLIIKRFDLNNNYIQEVFNSNEDNDKKWSNLIDLVVETSQSQNKIISKMEIEDIIFQLNSYIEQTYSKNDEILLQFIQKICNSINDLLKLIKGNKDIIRNILKYCFPNNNIPVTIVNNEIVINGTISIKLN